MGTIRNTQSGFGAVEALLVVIIIGLVGFVGYYVWHAKQTVDKNLTVDTSITPTVKKTVTTSQPTDPYAGWKSATLQYEKISYKYPADWTVKDLSSAQPKDSQGCTYPGIDNVTLTSPANEQVVLRTGLYCIGDGGAAAFGSIPVKSLGQNLYLAFENNSGGAATPTAPAFACLAKTTSPNTPMDFTSKNIFTNGTDGSPVNYFCYYPFNLSTIAGDIPTSSVDGIKNSTDFATAQKIFESMSY